MSILEDIVRWKEKRNAIILAHNYQIGEVQDLADFVGDSLDLARRAASTDADVIVFCGVHFMAETAAILSPDKTVVIPDRNAGCPMANMINPRQLRTMKEEFPGAVVVTYVNSSAAVKAETDICCTSANAVQVVESIPEDKEIIFAPDQNLGQYTASETGRKMHLWSGFCPTHMHILPEFVEEARKEHPDALFVAHPECRPEVIELADQVGSTSGILKFCTESDHKEFIIGTEIGILHRLRKENPGKVFYPATTVADCPNMKLITPEKVLWALQDLEDRIEVPEEIAAKALKAIEKMVETLPK